MTIRQDVSQDQLYEAIELNPYLTKKGLQFEAAEGRVTLRGEVGSYYQKQMATEALKKLSGVDEIDNQIEVVWQ